MGNKSIVRSHRVCLNCKYFQRYIGAKETKDTPKAWKLSDIECDKKIEYQKEIDSEKFEVRDLMSRFKSLGAQCIFYENEAVKTKEITKQEVLQQVRQEFKKEMKELKTYNRAPSWKREFIEFVVNDRFVLKNGKEVTGHYTISEKYGMVREKFNIPLLRSDYQTSRSILNSGESKKMRAEIEALNKEELKTTAHTHVKAAQEIAHQQLLRASVDPEMSRKDIHDMAIKSMKANQELTREEFGDRSITAIQVNFNGKSLNEILEVDHEDADRGYANDER